MPFLPKIKIPRPSLPRRRKKEPEPQPEFEDGDALQMSFLDHLDELRKRVFSILISVVIGTVIGFFVSTPALEYLQKPYCDIVGDLNQCQLNTLGPTEGVIIYFRVSLMIGAILAIPIITYQLLLFIMPGLKRKEKRFVRLSLPAITLLFLIGSAFAWFVLMPPALGFLEGFQPTIFEPEWTADLYISFVTALVFWMGVAFETPLVFFVLSLLGLVSARPLIRNWRFAVVASAMAAALITPTIDPVNMFLVMGPLMALYAFSIVLVMIGRRISGVQ